MNEATLPKMDVSVTILDRRQTTVLQVHADETLRELYEKTSLVSGLRPGEFTLQCGDGTPLPNNCILVTDTSLKAADVLVAVQKTPVNLSLDVHCPAEDAWHHVEAHPSDDIFTLYQRVEAVLRLPPSSFDLFLCPEKRRLDTGARETVGEKVANWRNHLEVREKESFAALREMEEKGLEDSEWELWDAVGKGKKETVELFLRRGYSTHEVMLEMIFSPRVQEAEAAALLPFLAEWSEARGEVFPSVEYFFLAFTWGGDAVWRVLLSTGIVSSPSVEMDGATVLSHAPFRYGLALSLGINPNAGTDGTPMYWSAVADEPGCFFHLLRLGGAFRLPSYDTLENWPSGCPTVRALLQGAKNTRPGLLVRDTGCSLCQHFLFVEESQDKWEKHIWELMGWRRTSEVPREEELEMKYLDWEHDYYPQRNRRFGRSKGQKSRRF